MKILTVCEGGTVRSVALARVAKQRGHDAVPLSSMWNKPETFAMLSEWAEKILYILPHQLELIPEEHREKAHFVEGMEKDPWCNPLNKQLLELVKMRLDELL